MTANGDTGDETISVFRISDIKHWAQLHAGDMEFDSETCVMVKLLDGEVFTIDCNRELVDMLRESMPDSERRYVRRDKAGEN